MIWARKIGRLTFILSCHIMPKYPRIHSGVANVAQLFRPVAEEIVTRVVQTVFDAANTPAATAGLSSEERLRLSNRNIDKATLENLVSDLIQFFQYGTKNLTQLHASAEDRLAVFVLRRSLDRYKRRRDGDAVTYFTRRIEPLFKALSLPHGALLWIDGNLAASLPRRPVATIRAMRSSEGATNHK